MKDPKIGGFLKAAAALFAVCLSLSACQSQRKLELTYGESYTISDEALDGIDTPIWEVEDESIITVQDGCFVAVAPGATKAEAKNGDKTVVQYKITVSLVPIEQIVLASDTVEITQDESQKISYTLLPANASDYGLIWKSSDENIAIIDETGTVTGISEGETTAVVSTEDGEVSGVLYITVKPKSAYEQLSENDRKFVDQMVKNMSYFKNPASVQITAISNITSVCFFRASAQNGFGATVSNDYFLLESGDIDQCPVAYTYSSDKDRDPDRLDLINTALHEKYGS